MNPLIKSLVNVIISRISNWSGNSRTQADYKFNKELNDRIDERILRFNKMKGE